MYIEYDGTCATDSRMSLRNCGDTRQRDTEDTVVDCQRRLVLCGVKRV